MIGSSAVEFLRVVPLGTRVVVRYTLHDDPEAGASDAIGDLVARTDGACTVDTRRGRITVADADVIAAKTVPPAPEPRNRRRSP